MTRGQREVIRDCIFVAAELTGRAQAVRLIDGQPVRQWTLDNLDHQVGLSRSVFADRLTILSSPAHPNLSSVPRSERCLSRPDPVAPVPRRMSNKISKFRI